MRTPPEKSEYVICVNNEGCRASLVIRKLYKVVPDPASRKRGLLRVIDESGEDYLFPEHLFVPVRVPKEAEEILARATETPV